MLAGDVVWSYWSQLLIGVIGCNYWSDELVGVFDLRHWLGLLVRVVGQSFGLELVVATIGWSYWLELLVVITGQICRSSCWLELLYGVVGQNHLSELYIAEVLIFRCLLKVLVYGVVRWFCWSWRLESLVWVVERISWRGCEISCAVTVDLPLGSYAGSYLTRHIWPFESPDRRSKSQHCIRLLRIKFYLLPSSDNH